MCQIFSLPVKDTYTSTPGNFITFFLKSVFRHLHSGCDKSCTCYFLCSTFYIKKKQHTTIQCYIGMDVLPTFFSSSSLHHAGCAALFLLLWQCRIIHLSNNLCKQLIHHSLALGRSFNKGAAPFLSQGSSIRPGDFALRFQVDLIPHKDQWHLLEALDSHDLISHWSDILWDREDMKMLYNILCAYLHIFQDLAIVIQMAEKRYCWRSSSQNKPFTQSLTLNR